MEFRKFPFIPFFLPLIHKSQKKEFYVLYSEKNTDSGIENEEKSAMPAGRKLDFSGIIKLKYSHYPGY